MSIGKRNEKNATSESNYGGQLETLSCSSVRHDLRGLRSPDGLKCRVRKVKGCSFPPRSAPQNCKCNVIKTRTFYIVYVPDAQRCIDAHRVKKVEGVPVSAWSMNVFLLNKDSTFCDQVWQQEAVHSTVSKKLRNHA